MHAETGAIRGRAFVGRTRECAALSSALEAVNEGRGTLCLISGEPGIGKSRLLAEFAADRVRAGDVIHWGFAWEAGGAPGYWPWIQILRSVLATEHARATLAAQTHLTTALAELVPELLPNNSNPVAILEPAQARFRLMDAVSSLLLQVAAQSPLILVLEDLHAADADSLALLEFVTRQLQASRALIIGSFRDAEVQKTRVGNVIARLRRSAIQLGLRRLDRDEVREYCRAATGERPLEQQVTELVTLTEGHPLYLAEVVQLGLSRGNLRSAPGTLSIAVLERAEDLPPETRALLPKASVLGRSFSLTALAAVAECAEADLKQWLAPALSTGLLETDPNGSLRFEHMLVREAFHDSLPPAERRRLHEREANRMRSRAESGVTVPWSALARHLEESGSVTLDTATAWRNAAAQADARHAFDDAAVSYARAIRVLGEIPGALPETRARLLLDLASAQIRAGDLEAGRRNSTDAFRIAESLDNAGLLTDAALVYGSIFTFGSVDPRLVSLLKTALARVHADDTDRRARLQARLAAAMQPAADPDEPASLAREAIQLARINGDARTLLTTLRSAVSAMMDFGDPAERLALNLEHVRLARQLGDAPECMRGYMRAAVDAMELGDAPTLDDAIEQCDVLAEQLGMPHYQWTAAAFRVMRATTRGDFALAQAALARARRHAERAQDSNAAFTLLCQQIELAEMMGEREQLAELVTKLDAKCANFPHSEMYLKPDLLAMGVRTLGREPLAGSMDEAYLRGIVRFSDMGSFASLGLFLAALGDRALIEIAYEAVSRYPGRCGHWGLMGLRWMGPLSGSLGHLAAARGQLEAANAHFASALEVVRRMDARAWAARLSLEWVEALQNAGGAAPRAAVLLDEAQTLASQLGMAGLENRIAACRGRLTSDGTGTQRALAETAPATDAVAAAMAGYFRLSRDGELWICECQGQSFRLRDSRGMQMLARLVAAPGQEVHVLDLVGSAASEEGVDSGDAGEMLDDRARREYRRRIESLQAELEEAESMNDLAGAEAAREELENLSAELSRAFGLGGRARRAGSNVERARVNVQRRLKHALDRINKECPPAGRHLDWAVRTGSFCSYRPH